MHAAFPDHGRGAPGLGAGCRASPPRLLPGLEPAQHCGPREQGAWVALAPGAVCVLGTGPALVGMLSSDRAF